MIRNWKRVVFWLFAAAAFVWIVSRTDYAALWQVIGQLDGPKVGLLLSLNIIIFCLFALRWWIYVKGTGEEVSLLSLIRYRLTSFGITYFTPGPQMGGEPYQVMALSNRAGLSTEAAASSVSMDKLTELVANFAFLLLGVGVVVLGGYLPLETNLTLVPLVALLLLAPLAYLFMLWLGKKPLTAVLEIPWLETIVSPETEGDRGTARSGGILGRFREWLAQTRNQGVPIIKSIEVNLNRILRNRPLVFAAGFALTLLTWLLLIGEYHLALRYLGIPLTFGQTIVVLTAARLAFLLPAPGGLGALEASQVIALQALGFGPAAGLGISLLIRARDVLFGATGLALAGRISE